LSERPRPDHLRVEHLATAFGIDTTRPRLSWWLPDGAGRQSGYRIRADNGWDTGHVTSDESVLVGYGGPPLGSGARVGWQVKVWTDRGESQWSEPHRFELGLLGPGDWSARWITPAEPARPPAGQRPAMFVRGEFELGHLAVRARLYATAHGLYEAFLNGVRVGDAELTPGFTEYRERLQVQAYDITALLRPGRNVLGAILSDGWFRGQVGLPRASDQWGSELGFLAQVVARYADGSTAVAGTGAGWRCAPSHISAADLIAGQSADLRRQPEGWSEPGFDAAGWEAVHVTGDGCANLVASPAPPVRAVAELAAVTVRRVPRGQVFDLGQNINGWVRLRDLRAAPHHARVPLRTRRGPSAAAGRQRPDRRRRPHRPDPYRLVRLQRRARQPPARGGRVELPRQRLRHPDRLPDARAGRLDRRLAGLRAGRRLPLRRRRVHHQVAARPSRRAVAERRRRQPGAEPARGVRGRLPGRDERLGRLGRRVRDRAVGDLPRLR
jgi:Alpha-L-rhamnosidase N-terminal domain